MKFGLDLINCLLENIKLLILRFGNWTIRTNHVFITFFLNQNFSKKNIILYMIFKNKYIVISSFRQHNQPHFYSI